MDVTTTVFAQLRKELEQGTYPVGSRFPSEISLSDRFSVNRVTINKAVSRLVSQGYLERGIRGAGTRVLPSTYRFRGQLAFIGKLNTYSMEILRGVQRECLHQNYSPIVFSPTAEELPYCLAMMNPRTVSGIITIGYGILKPENPLPLVCLDYNLPHPVREPHIHFIGSNNFAGGKAMIQEVLHRGHKEIAIFSSERFVYGLNAPIAPRIEGFHEALRESGYTDFRERTFYGMPDSLPDAKASLGAILAKYPNVSIICTDSDLSAELILQAAKALKVACPGKIALTGFGDISHLDIASVNQHPERQGQLAVRWILSMSENGGDEGEKTTVESEEMVETEVTRAECIPIHFT